MSVPVNNMNDAYPDNEVFSLSLVCSRCMLIQQAGVEVSTVSSGVSSAVASVCAPRPPSPLEKDNYK